MIQKTAYIIALLIALAVVTKAIAVLAGPPQDIDVMRSGMLANIFDLIAAATLLMFALLSLLGLVPWVQTKSSAIAVLAFLGSALVVQLAYATAYADVRVDFILGACLYVVTAVLVLVSRREQFFGFTSSDRTSATR